MGEEEQMMSGREDQMTGRALLSQKDDDGKNSKRSASRGERMPKTAKKHKPSQSQNDTEDLKSKSSKTQRSSHLDSSRHYQDKNELLGLNKEEKAKYKVQLQNQIAELKSKKEKFSFKLIERKLQNEAADKDVEILTKKVENEVTDLNK